MPSGGSSPIGLTLEEYEHIVECWRMAKKYSMEFEWFDWFLGGVKKGMSIEEAATAAKIEWDF